MVDINKIVLTGDRPSEIRAAYENDPKIPAPPVPEDHVEMTFLYVFRKKVKHIFKCIYHGDYVCKLTYDISMNRPKMKPLPIPS